MFTLETSPKAEMSDLRIVVGMVKGKEVLLGSMADCKFLLERLEVVRDLYCCPRHPTEA